MANDYKKALGVAKQDIKDLVNAIGKIDEKVVESAAKIRRELGTVFKIAGQDELSAIVIKQQTAINGLNKELEKQNTIIKKLTKTEKENTTGTEKNTKATNKATEATKNRIKSQKKLQTGFGGLIASTKSLLAAFGVVGAVQLFASAIKNTFKLIKTLDSLNFAMNVIAGSAKNVAENQEFLMRITEAYGAEIVTTTERYIKFLAAAQQSNVSLQDTQNIFETMTKASGVLGLKTDELRGIYLALEQMLSKGKVTTEELRRQLGERLPGAMGIMADALGVTIPLLDQMLKKGEVLSATALPLFAEQVELAFGIGGVTKVETLQAAFVRFGNAFTKVIQGFRDGSNITQSLMNKFDFLTKHMKSIIMAGATVIKTFIAYKVAAGAVALRTILVAKRLELMTLRARAAAFGINGVSFALMKMSRFIKNNWTGIVVIAMSAALFLIDKLNVSILETNKALADQSKEFLKNQQTAEKVNASLEKMVVRYDDLTSKTTLNKDEQIELERIISTLARTVPLAVDEIDDYGEALRLNTKSVTDFVEANRDLAATQARASNVELSSSLRKLTTDYENYVKVFTEGGGAEIAGMQVFINKKTGELSSGVAELTEAQKLLVKQSKFRLEQSIATTKRLIEGNEDVISSDTKIYNARQLQDQADEKARKKKAEDEAKEIARLEALNKERRTIENAEAEIKVFKEEQKTLEDLANKFVQVKNAAGEDVDSDVTQKDRLDQIAEEIKLREKLIKTLKRTPDKAKKPTRDRTKFLRETVDLEKQILINSIKQKIAIDEQEINDIQTSYARKIELANEHVRDLKEILDLEQELAVDAVVERIEKEKATLRKSLNNKEISEEEFTERIKKLHKERSEAVVIIQQKTNAEVFKDLSDLDKKKLKLEDDRLNEEIAQIKANADAKITIAKQVFFESRRTARDQADLDEAVSKISIEAANEVIKARLVLLKIERDILKESDQNFDHIQEQIDRLEKGFDKFFSTLSGTRMKDAFGELTSTFSDLFDVDLSGFDFIIDDIANKVNKLFDKESLADWANLSRGMISEVLDASLLRYDLELEKAATTRDLILENDLASEEEKEIAKERFAQREKIIKTAQAKAERKNNIIKIGMDTAVAIVKTYAQYGWTPAGILAASLMGGIGLVQAGIVASQPLPEFWGGTTNAPQGWASVDEKGPEVHTNKYGAVKSWGSSDGANARFLEDGDKIYPTHEDFFNKHGGDEMQRAVWDMNMSSNGQELSKQFVDRSLLNEMGGMRRDMDSMGRKFLKIANRPVNVNNKIILKDERAY